jgi:hypothetical protein
MPAAIANVINSRLSEERLLLGVGCRVTRTPATMLTNLYVPTYIGRADYLHVEPSDCDPGRKECPNFRRGFGICADHNLCKYAHVVDLYVLHAGPTNGFFSLGRRLATKSSQAVPYQSPRCG